jgi:hypothetical protein
MATITKPCTAISTNIHHHLCQFHLNFLIPQFNSTHLPFQITSPHHHRNHLAQTIEPVPAPLRCFESAISSSPPYNFHKPDAENPWQLPNQHNRRHSRALPGLTVHNPSLSTTKPAIKTTKLLFSSAKTSSQSATNQCAPLLQPL